ncbi:MAG: FAD-dependent oxidoreductase [Patescibacteria group bacterium]|nr:FAD-dependent oxidoreductase [Patescibacteria group bacterium]MBU1877073.1 FAD-dependent oxidoreductase [Patescibacteria group bacterium]
MIYDLIIIGGGPAGITAGIYAMRQRLNALLITKNFGGQINKKAVAIGNYPGFDKISGAELIKKFKNHLKKTGIKIEKSKVNKVEKDGDVFLIFIEGGQSFKSKAVIIASGSDPRPLEVAGEKEFLGKGVSYCPLCDGPLFKNKNVAIIGSGNSAFETAIFLSNIVNKIYILECGPQVKTFIDNQEIIKKTNKAKVIVNAALKEIQGDNFVKSIIYQDKETAKEKILKVDGVFVEIGYLPATYFVKDLVDFSERDEILTDPNNSQTRTLGLFAAGDVNVGKYKQIITACAEGATAALSAFEYLKKQK